MDTILQTPMFGILLSLVAFELGLIIQKKTKLIFLNPLLLAILFIIGFLLITNIDLKQYQLGGNIIHLFLGPATVVLAVPLYQQVQSLKNYFVPIMIGIAVGILVGISATLICCYVASLEPGMVASILPKSITTPIGIELSLELGGTEAITVLTILVTGIMGAVICEPVCKLFKIDHPIAKGIALGTSAHAIGTSKALQLGHIEGAMSSLAIGVSGILSVIIIPFIWTFVQSFFY